MKDFLNNKLAPAIMRFVNTRALRALKDGIMYSMPPRLPFSALLTMAMAWSA